MDWIQAHRIFLAIAKTGSFVGAAEQTATARATVSTTLAALERKLGCKLLVRNTRHVRLTAEGTVYRLRAQDWVDEWDRMQALFKPTAPHKEWCEWTCRSALPA